MTDRVPTFILGTLGPLNNFNMPTNKILKTAKRTEKKVDKLTKEIKPSTTNKRNRRRRYRRRTKNVVENLDGLNNQSMGVIAQTTENPFTSGKMRSRVRIEGEGLNSLPPRCQEFVHRHCNPCGEKITFTENSKVPDGGLPNSTVLELREALIVRMPGMSANTTLPLTGASWTLTVIHLPLFRNPVILVANIQNSEMTTIDRAALIRDWNTSEHPPVYPDWRQLDGLDTYYAAVQWTGLRNVDPPTDTGTAAIQQFRITADGMTMFNNTPDLINQGMVVGAQWPANRAVKVETADAEVAGYTGLLHVYSSENNFRLEVPIPIDLDTANTVSYNNMSALNVGATADLGWRYLAFRASSNVADIVETAVAEWDMIVNDITISAGDTLTYVISRAAGGLWSASVTNTTTSTLIFSFTGVINPNVYYGWTLVSTAEFPTITTLQLPPTDTENIIQSTPKAVYMSAKEQNGIYMVKRIFQPIFNVQEASERRQIVLTDAEYSREFTVAPRDVLDLNYGVGCTVWSSIPTSCAPAIKLVRDVEIVAGENSAYMPFMKSNGDKCEAALTICHMMGVHHPFMYPESYNILGGLMGIISNVVSKIPILGNVVGAIPGIIKTITGNEQKEESGSSQNRLASTNIEELAKLAQLLMSQLKLN